MLLETKNLGFGYNKNNWIFKGVSLTFEPGIKYCIMGESGAGKSTLAKLLAGYERPTEGKILINGAPFSKGYRQVQLIFQHPEKAVNPRFKMKAVLAEGGALNDKLMDSLGIEKPWLDRYPGELSGGELQRFCIARALGGGARFLIADEMSTMLDLITQAQIWDVLLKEVKKRDMGLIVVTHDTALGRKICDEFIQIEDYVCI